MSKIQEACESVELYWYKPKISRQSLKNKHNIEEEDLGVDSLPIRNLLGVWTVHSAL